MEADSEQQEPVRPEAEAGLAGPFGPGLDSSFVVRRPDSAEARQAVVIEAEISSKSK